MYSRILVCICILERNVWSLVCFLANFYFLPCIISGSKDLQFSGVWFPYMLAPCFMYLYVLYASRVLLLRWQCSMSSNFKVKVGSAPRGGGNSVAKEERDYYPPVPRCPAGCCL